MMAPGPIEMPAAQEIDAPARDGARPKILIVDDSTLEARLAAKILDQQLPLDVIFAADGVEALAMIAAETPDLVLTDMQMPRMDGLTLAARVRVSYPFVPVILMTAHGSEETALIALQQGAASYVPKRHLARDLVETVRSVLSVSGAESQHRRTLGAWEQTEFRFRLENDASLIAGLVDHIQQYARVMSAVNEVELIRVGVALHEALTNAIYHGNLELESELRGGENDGYYQLAEDGGLSRVGGEGMSPPRPSSNRTGGFPASGFPLTAVGVFGMRRTASGGRPLTATLKSTSNR